MNQLTATQTLLQQMLKKGYLAVIATITERLWFDSSATTSTTITAEIINNELVVKVDGEPSACPDAHIFTVVRRGVKFEPTKLAPVEPIDLGDMFTLSKEEAHMLHYELGVITMGLKGFNQKAAASTVLNRPITTFVGLTHNEAEKIVQYVQSVATIARVHGNASFVAVA